MNIDNMFFDLLDVTTSASNMATINTMLYDQEMALKRLYELDDYEKNKRKEYEKKVDELEKQYGNLKEESKAIYYQINANRRALREEIKCMEKFLDNLGNLDESNKLSIFDFKYEFLEPQKVEFNKIESHNLGLMIYRNDLDNKICKSKIDADYNEDLKGKQSNVENMEIINQIVNMYENAIVIIKDCITEKVIPDLEFIEGFLYADAIRELVLDGEPLDGDIRLHHISEYRIGKYNGYFQYVKNVFMFYKQSIEIYNDTILKNLFVSGRNIKQEQENFNKKIECIKKQQEKLEELEVI